MQTAPVWRAESLQPADSGQLLLQLLQQPVAAAVAAEAATYVCASLGDPVNIHNTKEIYSVCFVKKKSSANVKSSAIIFISAELLLLKAVNN